MTRPAALAVTTWVLTAVLAEAAAQQDAPDPPWRAGATGEVLYGQACASCHGSGGRGAAQALVGFDVPLPDFTDCSFATREADGDWGAVVHGGGPVRGFASMMPAFGSALTDDEIQRVLDHVRTFCGDPAWPRGELNFPRALVTEKAYPEDEAVLTLDAPLEGTRSLRATLVYERRFGARNQVELIVPFLVREREDAAGWTRGVGDVAVALKRALHHSFEAGRIFSAAAELILPTGEDASGLGSGSAAFEPFLAFGQALPADGFLQLQAGAELPLGGPAEAEGFGRLALGRTFTEGLYGRAWSPMVEILADRELEGGAATAWAVLPQLQVSLNTRQHVLLNAGARIPVADEAGQIRLVVYLLWDWFDGGLRDGW